MAVESRWRAVGGPSGVSNASVRVEGLGQIRLGFVDELLQLRHLSNLFERKDLILLVSVDRQTGRIITTILETGETCSARLVSWCERWKMAHGPGKLDPKTAKLTIDKSIEDVSPVLLHKIVDVAEDTTASSVSSCTEGSRDSRRLVIAYHIVSYVRKKRHERGFNAARRADQTSTKRLSSARKFERVVIEEKACRSMRVRYRALDAGCEMRVEQCCI